MVASATCSQISKSAQRCSCGDLSAPENLTITCMGLSPIRRAVNLGNSPAAEEPTTPKLSASSARCG